MNDRTGKMVQAGECLVEEHEDPNLGLQHSHEKLVMAVRGCNPILGDTETRGFLYLSGQQV